MTTRAWPQFRSPPITTNARGEERKVGIEVEFSGLDVRRASAIVVGLFGGDVAPASRFSWEVRGAAFGTWQVAIDSRLLTEEKYKPLLDKLGAGAAMTELVEGVLDAVLTTWVPCEIASPPIPLSRLGDTERLRGALLDRDATGTTASPLYLFGFQLNPEVPVLDARCIGAHLRAFCALYDWLACAVDMDVTRRLTSVAEPFPDDYRARWLDPAYDPELDDLITDYLDACPDRERAVDMLPLFAHLRPELVRRRALEPDKINARPTFHYRLPNSMVDAPEWSFALEWNRWVEIERLAADPARLDRVARDAALGIGDRSPEAWIERARGWGVEAA